MENARILDDWLNGQNQVIEIEMIDNNDDDIVLLVFIILLHIVHQRQLINAELMNVDDDDENMDHIVPDI
jgi:hypothetical protein